MTIKEASCKITASASLTAGASKRTLLARQYFHGAAEFAKLSVTLRSQTSSPLEVAYVTGAIFSSIAALEAAINAVLIDAPDWENTDKLCLLDKCDQLLSRHSRMLERGKPVCQRVAAIIKLRNELVHYKPEWDDKLDAHKQLRKKFQSVISQKLLPINFPKDYVISDFALKAVEWCGDFAKDFFEKIDMLEEVDMWNISQMEVPRDAPYG